MMEKGKPLVIWCFLYLINAFIQEYYVSTHWIGIEHGKYSVEKYWLIGWWKSDEIASSQSPDYSLWDPRITYILLLCNYPVPMSFSVSSLIDDWISLPLDWRSSLFGKDRFLIVEIKVKLYIINVILKNP